MYSTATYITSHGNETTRVSTLCVHAFTIHFYLRDRQAKNHTSVIAVVRQNNRRIKISLPIRVHPLQWDKRKERLYLSDFTSLEYNKQLSHIYCRIENLCLSLQDIRRVKIYFSDDFPMANRNDVNVERVLRDAFRMYYAEKKSKKSTRDDREKRLNKLCRIIKQDMKVNTSPGFLSNGYEQLKEFVVDYYGGYTSGANGMCEQFAMLLNYVRTKPNFSKYCIEPITHKRFNSQKTYKTNLLDSEIQAIENVQLDDSNENNVRYRFLIEAECGSRNSDLSKVVELIKGIDADKRTKAYKELKEGRTAVAGNTEKLRFYISQLTDSHDKISCTYANELLRVIARKANLNRIIETMNNKPLSECISTHFGRHTFVTNMLKKGYTPEEVIKFTGHASTDMVNRIYAHLSEQDHEDEVERIIERVENLHKPRNQESHHQPKVRYAKNVEDAREILIYLGVETSETRLGKLISMICLREHDIIEKCKHRINIDDIKAIFNTDIPIAERCECLSDIIKGLSDRP